MAFYQTTSYRNYNTKDPLLQIKDDIILANSNISLGAPSYTITGDANVTIPANNIVNNYMVWSAALTANRNATTATATDILVSLREKLKAQINQHFSQNGTFPNGTSFSFKFFNNTTGGFLTIVLPGTGVSFGTSNGDVENGNATNFIMIVTGQTLLGDAADTISIINSDY